MSWETGNRQIGTDPIWGITYEERIELCQAVVTLEGRKAKISGTMLAFPSVRQLHGNLHGQWSWPAVQRIVKSGGKFIL